jgi:hypothetical protein
MKKASTAKKASVIILIIAILLIIPVWQIIDAKMKTTKLEFKNYGDFYGVKAYDILLSGDVVIPETYKGKPVTRIEYGGFSSCSKLTGITIPPFITSISDYAFSGCIMLSTPIIPDSVTYIGAHAFEYCSKISSFDVPDCVTELGEYVFIGCSGLTSVTLSQLLII